MDPDEGVGAGGSSLTKYLPIKPLAITAATSGFTFITTGCGCGLGGGEDGAGVTTASASVTDGVDVVVCSLVEVAVAVAVVADVAEGALESNEDLSEVLFVVLEECS